MAFHVGDRVVAESESTTRQPRTGTVREVLHGDPTPRYRIEWDDGHTTSLTPEAGALPAVSKPPHAAACPRAPPRGARANGFPFPPPPAPRPGRPARGCPRGGPPR